MNFYKKIKKMCRICVFCTIYEHFIKIYLRFGVKSSLKLCPSSENSINLDLLVIVTFSQQFCNNSAMSEINFSFVGLSFVVLGLVSFGLSEFNIFLSITSCDVA